MNEKFIFLIGLSIIIIINLITTFFTRKVLKSDDKYYVTIISSMVSFSLIFTFVAVSSNFDYNFIDTILGCLLYEIILFLPNIIFLKIIICISRKHQNQKNVTILLDKYEQLEKIKKLLDMDAITSEEFEKEKQKILNN